MAAFLMAVQIVERGFAPAVPAQGSKPRQGRFSPAILDSIEGFSYLQRAVGTQGPRLLTRGLTGAGAVIKPTVDSNGERASWRFVPWETASSSSASRKKRRPRAGSSSQ